MAKKVKLCKSKTKVGKPCRKSALILGYCITHYAIIYNKRGKKHDNNMSKM